MSNLKQFLNSKMRLSHIYQPLMIKTLLENKGIADKSIIAKQFLEYDFSQVEYYEKITNTMPGRILRKHQIVSKEKDAYHLEEFDSLSEDDINELIAICEAKIKEYIEKRGNDIWEHRRRNRRPIRGSVRYEVLKRANGRCELCGISKDEKALEVDHIVPKNTGGEDSINNYQALCFTCNSNKRDTDDTDFRDVNAKYEHRDKSCIFCSLNGRVIVENNLAVAFYDKYPVTYLHTLIIPKRHCEDYFELTHAELNAINQLIFQLKDFLIQKDSTIDGFNIGNNNGGEAGQTIFHAHIHLIPRRKGDVDNPIGGVRNVIFGKGKY